MKIGIRQMELPDKNEIDALFLKKNSELKWNFSEFLNHKDCFGMVVVENGDIVGFGALIRYHTPLQGIIGRLEDIFVSPNCQGKGYGKMIINELIKLGNQLKLEQIVLTSNPKREVARHIYISLGFDLYGTGVFVKKL